MWGVSFETSLCTYPDQVEGIPIPARIHLESCYGNPAGVGIISATNGQLSYAWVTVIASYGLPRVEK